MFKRLGEVINETKEESESKIVRPAILVHSGPNGEMITFTSADGDISFDDKRIKTIVKNHNKEIMKLAAGYGDIEKMPIGAFPPILDAHANDSNDRIRGRLASLLRVEKRNVPGIGEKVTCAVADITFLGKDTVERVKDGRIYHLSIGIDEATNTLGETSTVIKPAAPGAMLLKQGNKNMSKLKKLNAIKESLTTMSKKISDSNALTKLTRKQGEISHRLTGLMRSGKLTPAESKKLDIKKLSKLSDDSLETVLETFDAREPQVMAGQIGTTDAVDFATLADGMKSKQIKNLKSEVRADFKRLTGKRLSSDIEEKIEDKQHGADVQMAEEKVVEPVAKPNEVHAKHMEHLSVMRKHLEEGKIEEAKSHLSMMEEHSKEMAKHMGCATDEKHLEMGDVKSEDYKNSMDELQKQIDELNTQMSRIGGMVDELITVEKDEAEVLPPGSPVKEEHENLEGDPAKKELTEEEKVAQKKLADETANDIKNKNEGAGLNK